MLLGLGNFAAPENLKCVRQEGLENLQFLNFIQHSKGNVILLQEHMLQLHLQKLSLNKFVTGI